MGRLTAGGVLLELLPPQRPPHNVPWGLRMGQAGEQGQGEGCRQGLQSYRHQRSSMVRERVPAHVQALMAGAVTSTRHAISSSRCSGGRQRQRCRCLIAAVTVMTATTAAA